MANNPKYFIVEASALPEIFLKVAEAKQLLATGQLATVNEAAKHTGISRSAFYKYRDALLPFENMSSGRIITFQLIIHDQPGIFANCNSNIRTINSIVPTDGCAVVTVSAETIHITGELEEMLQQLRNASGVIKAEILAG